jgi:hypothetical protein
VVRCPVYSERRRESSESQKSDERRYAPTLIEVAFYSASAHGEFESGLFGI